MLSVKRGLGVEREQGAELRSGLDIHERSRGTDTTQGHQE